MPPPAAAVWYGVVSTKELFTNVLSEQERHVLACAGVHGVKALRGLLREHGVMDGVTGSVRTFQVQLEGGDQQG